MYGCVFAYSKFFSPSPPCTRSTRALSGIAPMLGHVGVRAMISPPRHIHWAGSVTLALLLRALVSVSSPPADDESSQPVNATPSTPARAQTIKLLANEFLIKTVVMIYPLKNNKAACKIPPINAPKKTFFAEFLPKIFYMIHCETYREISLCHRRYP